MKVAIFRRTLLLGLLGCTLVGCFLKRSVPLVPQTKSASCSGTVPNSEDTEIFVVDRGWRLSLILRSEDVVEELGWMVDEVHNHSWIEVIWGEVDEVVDADTLQKYSGEALLENNLVLVVRGIQTAPNHEIEKAELIKLRVGRTALSHLARGIRQGIQPTETGASAVALTFPSDVGTLYRGTLDAGAGRNSVRWIAQRLTEGGCVVDVNTTRSSTVLAALK